RHRGISDAAALEPHVEPVIHARGRMKLDGGFLDIEVAAEQPHRLVVRQGQYPPVFSHCRVDVHQVMGVEHDLLHVHFGPVHPQAMKKTEVLSFHELRACDRARAASAWACRASGMACSILMNSWVTPR